MLEKKQPSDRTGGGIVSFKGGLSCHEGGRSSGTPRLFYWLFLSLFLHWVMLQKARKEGLGGDIQNEAGGERGSQEVNQVISLLLSPHETEGPCSDSRQKTSSLLVCDPLIYTPFRISALLLRFLSWAQCLWREGDPIVLPRSLVHSSLHQFPCCGCKCEHQGPDSDSRS